MSSAVNSMMIRRYATIVLLSLYVSQASAFVECRVATKGVEECNPYTHKMIRAKEVVYDADRKKLIVDKTLPVPKRKKSITIISVADMVEKYTPKPLRYFGSQECPYDIPKKLKEDELISSIIDHTVHTPIEAPSVSPIVASKEKNSYGYYTVERGDSFIKIAKKFNLPVKALLTTNGLKKRDILKVGQKLKLPLSQKQVDTLSEGTYKVKAGDTLSKIAKKFNLDTKTIANYNHLTSHHLIREGQVLKLPLPYIVKAQEAKKAKERAKIAKANKAKMLQLSGRHRLRVTATAYTSHRGQTDKTPFLAAWNNRIRPGMKIIAVSRDLLTRYGLRNGSRVKIGGLRGYYTVRDKMNKRFRKRIDIYMGLNRRKALQWGRRSVTISW